jgi:hypothetical protein
MRFRLYIDETGDHSPCVDSTAPVGSRYLGLVGVMIKAEDYEAFASGLEEFKRKHLPYDSDDPPILHRADIVNTRGAFSRLMQQDRRDAFDGDLLEFISRAPFRIIGIVIDKLTHGRAGHRALSHPYHYCLLAMLERYCGLLQLQKNTGDVIVESRGGAEDRAFEEAYSDLYQNGSGSRGYLSKATAQQTLTSKKPKLKKKDQNIAGLQLADLIAHTVTRDTLIRNQRLAVWTSPFAEALAAVIQSKYNCLLSTGRIAGYGRTLLQ